MRSCWPTSPSRCPPATRTRATSAAAVELLSVAVAVALVRRVQVAVVRLVLAGARQPAVADVVLARERCVTTLTGQTLWLAGHLSSPALVLKIVTTIRYRGKAGLRSQSVPQRPRFNWR